MAENGWRRVASDADLVEGVPRLVERDGEGILLARVRGAVHAVGHECPHYREKLEKGVLFGAEIVCKSHFARMDVTTGKVLSAPAVRDLPVYPVEVREGKIWVGPARTPSYPSAPSLRDADPRLFLIVGAGAAGSSAADTLRREGFTGRIVLVTEESERPYDRPTLSKGFMTGKAGEETLPLQKPEFYAAAGIELRTGARVVSVDTGARTAALADGSTIRWDRLLLATGGTPRRLSVPGADGPGTLLLRSAADARALLATATRSRSVVIVGAGFVGLELATSLGDRGLAVTVVAPEAIPLAATLGDRIGAALLAMHAARGVAFRLGRRAVRIGGAVGSKIVTLDDGSEARGDFVVAGLGIEPAVGFLAGTGLVEAGAVPVDAAMRTRVPDVFAAGDAAAVPSAGGPRRCEHWIAAERQGRRAALGMMEREPGPEEVDVFWSKQAGASLKYAGRGNGWDRIVYRGSVEKGNFLAGFYRGGVLQAAASIGMARDLVAVERILRMEAPLVPAKLADESYDIIAAAAAL